MPTAKIDGKSLLVYLDGELISVTTGLEFTQPQLEPWATVTNGEYSFTASKFEMPEWTLKQEWNYQWYRSGELPRKAKKAYRKKLIKMLYES